MTDTEANAAISRRPAVMLAATAPWAAARAENRRASTRPVIT